MARTIYERTRAWFVPTIANKNAPTVAEITAGTYLSGFMPKDGISVPGNKNMVDSSTIEDTFDAQEPGSWGGAPVQLTMYRDDTADTAWNLITYGTRGYLVFSRISKTNPVVAGQKVEVWPVAMHEPTPENSAANEMQKFVAEFAVTAAPSLKATVA